MKDEKDRDYRLKDGTKVPGFSEVVAPYCPPNPDSLCDYAVRQAAKGDPYREHRAFRGRIGTLAHDLIEFSLRDLAAGNDMAEAVRKFQAMAEDVRTLEPPAVVNPALRAWMAWGQWAEGHDIRPVHLEEKMVSERWEYGGTADFVGMIDGRLVSCDWKTGSRIREKDVLQGAAYGVLARECLDVDPQAHLIVRCDTKTGQHECRTVELYELRLAWRLFERLLGAFHIREAMKTFNRKQGQAARKWGA